MDDTKEKLSDSVRKSIEPRVITNSGVDFLVHNNEMSVKDLSALTDKYLPAPRRRTGTTTLARLQSYIDFTLRHKNEDSIVLVEGTVDKNSIKAEALTIFNADPKGGDDLKAGHGDFKCDYKFPISKELAAFIDNNGKRMSQADFALFLEDHITDMASPHDSETVGGVSNFSQVEKALGGKGADPITMLELSRGLEVRVTETVKNATKLQSGEMCLKYSTEHSNADGTPLTIPAWFLIRLPLFEGGQPVDVPVRLRYRVNEGTAIWFYELYQMNKAFDEAFDQAVAYIKEQTELPVFVV